jgi:hypothetical protein
VPDLGHSAFPHTEVDPKTNDVIYHKGVPMWAYFFGHALASSGADTIPHAVVDRAEKIADLSMSAYNKRLAAPDPEVPVEKARSEWDYYGEIPGLGGERLHIWRRIKDRRSQAAVTASKDIEPSEGHRVFNRLEELASYHRIRLEDMEDFTRYVGRR